MTKDGHNRVVAALAPRILQVLSVLLMAFWYSRYLGGFGLYRDGRVDGTAIFCWHPLFMTIAYLVCVAEAIQAFKAPPYNKIARSTQKTFHWVFHVIAMILTGVSLAAVFISHRINRRMDMYSVHSWVGIFTVGFTNLQGTVGLLAFLSPATGSVLREALLPYHKCCGVVTFLLGCVSILLGIQEQTAFIQAFQRPGLRDGVMQVPIVLSLVVTVAAVWVSYNHLVVWTAPEPQICAGRLDDQSDVEGLLLQAEDSNELERPSISLPVKGPSMNIES